MPIKRDSILRSSCDRSSTRSGPTPGFWISSTVSESQAAMRPSADSAQTGIQALPFGLGGECYAVAMWIDLAFHYPAGSQGFGCLAGNELNTVVAILSFLFSSVDVLHR